ncbi:MAG: hypothetical protein WA151_24115 [Desulfatirhabdiaceae bacterium]
MIKRISLGQRPEFQGDGLIRSMGGKKAAQTFYRRIDLFGQQKPEMLQSPFHFE